jgi:PAS domain S-box-containing protein
MSSKEFLPEEFNTSLMALTRCATLVTDLERRILFAGPTSEALLGYPADELVGRPLDMLILKEDLTYFVPNIYKITRERGSFHGEIVLLNRSGETFYGQLAAYLYPGNGEAPRSVIMSIHNVSMIKQLEKDYLHFKKLTSLGAITESITREMRTPLLAISGFAERMDHVLPQESSLRPYLSVLRKEIESLEAIVVQLEEFAGLPPPDYKKHDLVEVVQEVLEQSEFLKNGDPVRPRLKVSLDAQGRTIYMDRALVQKALKILLESSVEIAPEEGSIEVHVHADGEHVLIDVCRPSPSPSTFASDMTALLESCFSSAPQCTKIRLMTARRIAEDQGGRLESLGSPEKGDVLRLRLLKERRRKIRREPL